MINYAWLKFHQLRMIIVKVIYEFTEMNFVLIVEEIIPTFLTSGFLKECQIIPHDWDFIIV